jgi:hypothetical protein
VLNLRKYCSVLEVNPEDAYNLNLTLGACPDDERHRQLKAKADWLRDNGYEPSEAAEMLRGWLTRTEKYNGEISDTIKRSWAEIDQLVIVGKPPRKDKPTDYRGVVELFRRYGGWDALLDYIRYEDNFEIREITTDRWLSRLYLPTDLICIARSMYEHKVIALKNILLHFSKPGDSPTVQKLNEMFRTHLYCLMTPAIYRAEEIEYEGRWWGRCDRNILRRKYWCIEFDIAENQGNWNSVLPHRDYDGFDLQSAIILHLFELGYPIVSIVHSGRKSLHVWCSGAGLTNEEIETLILHTSPFGADTKAALTLSQFMRCPNPVHPSRPQHCFFLNRDLINHE